MLEHFNIIEFVNILKRIKASNYRFVKFPRKNESIFSNNEVILRHDIDFSLTAARQIALEEYNLEIQSIFFVYLNTPFYNIAFEKDKKIIEDILSFNHEIALHYDDNSNSIIAQEIEILTKMFSTARSDIISLHKPNIDQSVKRLSKKYPYFTTYDSNYFNNIEYFSDSKCKFNWDNFNSVLNSKKSFQLLLHPIWWFYEGKTLEEKFEKLCRLKIDEIHENIRNIESQPINI